MKRFFNITSHYQRVKGFYARYERLLMPATLVVGFLIDYVTFTNIQIKITFSILLIYWIVAGTAISFINLSHPDTLPQKLKYARLFAPLVVQFTFGALLGSSLVFYWLSGVFSVSWPIILMIAMLMTFNDIFRHYFLKPIIQVSVYFFTTLSLFSLILPFLFNSLSPWLFILAGVLSIIIFYPYIIFLSRTINNIQPQKRQMFISVFAILLVMNFLYFTNIIPPIPLFLREGGLYHSLKISGKSYIMKGEIENFWQKLIPGQTLHLAPDERVYFYTAIFAPARLQTTILHNWQYYDEVKKKWITQDVLSFKIIGGRKEGYKGYSFKSALAPGSWRIYVKNQRGQVLGRIIFDIQKTPEKVELQEVIR